MGIGSNHHSTWEGIVFQDYLVDNSSTWLPKTNAILIRYRGKEIIDLFVFIFCFAQIFICANFRLNQVIAVNSRRHSNLRATGLHELQQGHLCGSILHRHSIRLKIYIGGSSFKSLISSPFSQVCVKNFFSQCKRFAHHLSSRCNATWCLCIYLFDHFDIKSHRLYSL